MIAFTDGVKAFDQRMTRHFGDPPQERLTTMFFEADCNGKFLTSELAQIVRVMQDEVISWELIPRDEFYDMVIRPLNRVLENLAEVEDEVRPRLLPPQDDDPQIPDWEEDTDAVVEPSSPPDQEMQDQDVADSTTKHVRPDI